MSNRFLVQQFVDMLLIVEAVESTTVDNSFNSSRLQILPGILKRWNIWGVKAK